MTANKKFIESLTVPQKLSTFTNRRNSVSKNSAQNSNNYKDSLLASTPSRSSRKHMSIFNRIKDDMSSKYSKIPRYLL